MSKLLKSYRNILTTQFNYLIIETKYCKFFRSREISTLGLGLPGPIARLWSDRFDGAGLRFKSNSMMMFQDVYVAKHGILRQRGKWCSLLFSL